MGGLGSFISSIFGGSTKNTPLREVEFEKFDPYKWQGMFGNYTAALDKGFQSQYKGVENSISELMARRGMLYSGPTTSALASAGGDLANQYNVQKQDFLMRLLGGIGLPAWQSEFDMRNQNAQNYNQWAMGNAANKNAMAGNLMGMVGGGLGAWMGSRGGGGGNKLFGSADSLTGGYLRR